jgi:hypothetical protein
VNSNELVVKLKRLFSGAMVVARTWASQSGLSQIKHGSKFGARIGLKGTSLIKLRDPPKVPPEVATAALSGNTGIT